MPLPLASGPYSPMSPSQSLWSMDPNKSRVSREKSLRKRLLRIVSKSSSTKNLIVEQDEGDGSDDVSPSYASSLLESPAIISPSTSRNDIGGPASQKKPDVEDITRLREIWIDSKCGPPVIHRTRPGSFSNLIKFQPSTRSSPISFSSPNNEIESSPSSRSKMPVASLTPRSSSSSSPIKRHERKSSTLSESTTVKQTYSARTNGSMLSPVATNVSTKSNSTQSYQTPIFNRRKSQGLFIKSFSEGKQDDEQGSKLAKAWSVYADFAINSKSQDAYIYSITRQQAWRSFVCWSYQHDEIDSLTFDIWHSMSLRFVFGGRNILTPTGEFALSGKSATKLLVIQDMEIDPNAWQLALDFPNTRVTSLYLNNDGGGGSTKGFSFASGLGPTNQQLHCTKTLDKLDMLADNSFDVISARGLWYMVKSKDLPIVVSELKRILKPGGCLELATVDIIPANTTRKVWKEIGNHVEIAGYEIYPSKSIVKGLFDCGFNNVCRSWLGLPQGWGSTPQMVALTGFINDYLWKFFIDRWSINNGESLISDLYSQQANESASNEGTLTRILLTSCCKPE